MGPGQLWDVSKPCVLLDFEQWVLDKAGILQNQCVCENSRKKTGPGHVSQNSENNNNKTNHQQQQQQLQKQHQQQQSPQPQQQR